MSYAVNQECRKCKEIGHNGLTKFPCGSTLCAECSKRWKCECIVCTDFKRDTLVLRAGYCRLCLGPTLSIDDKLCPSCVEKETPPAQPLESTSAWDLLWLLGSKLMCGVSSLPSSTPENVRAAPPAKKLKKKCSHRDEGIRAILAKEHTCPVPDEKEIIERVRDSTLGVGSQTIPQMRISSTQQTYEEYKDYGEFSGITSASMTSSLRGDNIHAQLLESRQNPRRDPFDPSGMKVGTSHLTAHPKKGPRYSLNLSDHSFHWFFKKVILEK